VVYRSFRRVYAAYGGIFIILSSSGGGGPIASRQIILMYWGDPQLSRSGHHDVVAPMSAPRRIG